MVGFTNSRSQAGTQTTLRAWIAARCQELSGCYSLSFESQWQPGLEFVAYSPALLSRLDDVLQQAAQTASPDSTVEIAVYLTRRGLEVEVSTDGQSSVHESLSSFRRESTGVSNGCCLTTYKARCPDGGVAWIVVQTHFARLRMTA
ncbi:MAG: hypothetical protein KF752_15800 [Pirellulaceae bacterium]|nr:hypothetical protein [Pirellulaceae bacterium]